ncbi:MAG: type II toxin-antitoxin system PemK/MazF family toxin [Armatimonadetes bacterium]|nr:type II toxin-antitoxin system PemK/MazF family toxin [Armatimonadota bacterium]
MPEGQLKYRRGEIRRVNLDPGIGAEARKTRSCLIVQNDYGNRHGHLTVVMPLIPGAKNAPYVVNVKSTPENGLEQDRYIDAGQIRWVDHRRVLGLVGTLESMYWPKIRSALDIVLGF